MINNEKLNQMYHKAKWVLQMHNRTPNGVIRDADTVLEDIMSERETEVTGVGEEVLNLFFTASCREDFCKLFEAMTGCSFDEYLKRCEKALSTNPSN